jgi:hypothetical protein
VKIQIQVRNHTTFASISADHGNHSTSSSASSARRPFAALLTLALTLTTVGLSSCVGLTNAGSAAKKSSGGAGTLSTSAASLSFGNVSVGNSKIQNVTITNAGTTAVNLSQASITGAGYSVASGNSSVSIPAGKSGTIQIQMAPASAGVYNGSLSIESDAANSPVKVALTGTGTEPVLAVSPGTLQFGNVKVGQSTTQPVTLTNSGNVDLVLHAAHISGASFGMSGLSLPATIAAGKNISFNVHFAPSAPQGMTGSIKFIDNAPNSAQSLELAGTGTEANASLVATPGSVSFGNVTLGSSGSQSVTLTNAGASAIAISQGTASGTGFSISGLNPITLNPGQTTSFTAKFAPTTTGSATGAVTITSNASNPTLTVNLVGVGTQPHLGANPSAVNFGSLAIGNSSLISVTLTNTGTGSVAISSGSASGAGFSMSGLSATTLNAGQSTSFTVKFAPTASGAVTGSVSIASNAPGGSPLAIPLSGTATQPQPGLTINPASVPFGNISVGSSSSQNVTLTNTGNATVNITGATASGAGFGLGGLGAQSINPGASVTFSARFAPTTAGSVTGSISISSNAPNSPAKITLSGAGAQGQLSANPSSASFGTVSTGSSNSQTITLSNAGSAAVSVSQANVTGAAFSISGMTSLPITINPGANKAFNVVFAPTTSGSATGTVQLVSNAPNSAISIALSGTGQTATQVLSANPSSLNFSSVNDGSSATLNVTLTNTGNSNVTISGATASGTGFSASGAVGTTLTPSQTATLAVTFAPTSTGAVTGSVAVNSNASNSPKISVSGTGVQQTSHTVGVSWTASVSTDVVGYHIYRGTVTGGPYSILDSAPVASDAYTDSTVQSGQTYFYVVRSVDNTGTESANSAQVQAVIP